MIIHSKDVICAVCGSAGTVEYEPCYKSLVEDYKDVTRMWQQDRKIFEETVAKQNANIRALACHIETLKRDINKCSTCGRRGSE